MREAVLAFLTMAVLAAIVDTNNVDWLMLGIIALVGTGLALLAIALFYKK